MISSTAACPLKVTLNGFDARAQTRLVMFLQRSAQGVCEVVDEEQAEAAIFDLDGVGGERLWLSFRERFHGPAVVMSIGEKNLDNAFWVRKPIATTDLLVAIERIQQRLKSERSVRETERSAERAPPAASVEPPVPVPAESISPAIAPVPAVIRRPSARRPSGGVPAKASGEGSSVGRAAGLAWNEQHVHDACGTIDDAVYRDPERRAELYYNPEEYLQGILQRACRRASEASCPVRLNVSGIAMFVLAGGRQVLSDTREKQLRPLCVTPISRLATLHDMREDELPKMQSHDPRLHSSEGMLWMITLWSSRGRVPKGTDPDAPVSLVGWPSFSRLLIPPHGMQITALWSTHPKSLMQTANLLAIPHRYVFAVYSACLTLGLIEKISAPNPATATEPDEPPVPAARRGLLGSLLRKLRWAR